MNVGRGWEIGATLMAILGVVAIARAAASHPAPLPVTAPSRAEPLFDRPVPYPADSLFVITVQRDVFRADRHATTVSYDSESISCGCCSSSVAAETCAGTGRTRDRQSPDSCVGGLPGADGPRVVRVGDVVGGLRITGIEKDRVLVIGMDTTWVLKMREPWKQ